jgi:cell wall assembly regulator SMI1
MKQKNAITSKKFRKSVESFYKRNEIRPMIGDPATKADCLKLEKKIGLKIPNDVVVLLCEFGGKVINNPRKIPADAIIPAKFSKQDATAEPFRFLELKEVPSYYKEALGLNDDDPEARFKAPKGVSKSFFSKSWIPFATNDMGELLCADIEPIEGGKIGQIIVVYHEQNIRPRIAWSTADFLAGMAIEYEIGHYYFGEDDMKLHKVRPDQFPSYDPKSLSCK